MKIIQQSNDHSKVSLSLSNFQIEKEITLHKSLDHEHVIKFLGTFSDQEYVFIRLELAHNNSLKTLYDKRARLISEPEIRYYMKQILAALNYLHGIGVIHRDLKLGNVLLTRKMQVKLCDFGFSYRLKDGEKMPLQRLGTPNYIAPEILLGDDLSEDINGYEVDIWALGVIMFMLVFGSAPFQTGDVTSTYGRILMNEYSFDPKLRVSREAKRLIRQLLQPSPKDRPTSARVLEHKWFSYWTPDKVPSKVI